MLTLTERITASFYAWELRGRGWELASYPVELEPPFRRCFMLPQLREPQAPYDDGRRPTFLSAIIDVVRGLTTSAAVVAAAPGAPYEEQEPFPADDNGSLVTLRVRVPRDLASTPAVAMQLLRALSAGLHPIAVEFVGCGGMVSLQVTCNATDREHIAESIAGYVPEVVITEETDHLTTSWDREKPSVVVDFGLSNEFFLPLQIFTTFSIDPYIALLPALARAADDEIACLQILFVRVHNPWDRIVLEAVVDSKGGSLFADAPGFVQAARDKLRTPLFAVVLRVATQAETEARAWELARGVHAFNLQFARPGSNELIPLENDGYRDDDHVDAFLARHSYRTGMLLSAEELIGFVHLPDASVRQAVFERSDTRTKAPTVIAKDGALVLGENIHRGVRAVVTLGNEERLQHMHIIGASGTGKSTLLLQLIAQDLASGHGLAVLDPHGDLIDEILARIPDKRIGDVIVFDPSDEEWPVGVNVLAATSAVEKQLLASDLVGIFQRLSTSWGDTMGTVLGNAVLAILESEHGGTLLDLRRFLIDDGFRRDFLTEVADEEVQFFWAKQYPLIGSRSIGPILTRLDTFLRSKLIRNIVGQRKPGFDFAAVLDDRKVFLAKLSQGLIGEESASLLGSLLATKFHQLALARQRLARGSRRPFFLYADEFQHFVTPSMASLLTEGRKYAVGLILAHQNMYQIRGSPVENALLGNAYTRIVFRVGDEDARRLADGFSFFEGKDLQSLKRGQAIVRLGTSNQDCNIGTLPLAEINPPIAEERRRAIIEHSREAFAVPLSEIGPTTIHSGMTKGASTARETNGQEAEVPRRQPSTSEVSAASSGTVIKRQAVARPKVAAELMTLGRGGAEHKYLQHLIKRLGEERGFRAIIEEQIGGGRSVDVVLRRESLALAFEISVTSETDHELRNLRKCAGLDFSQFFFVSTSRRKRDQIARVLKEDGSVAKVTAIGPEDIVSALEALAIPPPAESIVRGYKVKINRQTLSYEDVANKRSEIAKIVAKSLAS
jgi:hypothetical protein